jgi:tRNA uridine 5-carboxymethylaminomethyl modification enzyme
MIDDLTLQGVSEPYRMLTSRAEYRLRLRANNASTRLTRLGIETGCVGEERKEWFKARHVSRETVNTVFAQKVHSRDLVDTEVSIRRDSGEKSIEEWLRHSGITIKLLSPWLGDLKGIDKRLIEEMAEDAAYAPYLARQEAELRDLRASEELALSSDFPYGEVPGLSNEMVERLSMAAPVSLAAAGRVPGITPAALSALLVHARRWQNAA